MPPASPALAPLPTSSAHPRAGACPGGPDAGNAVASRAPAPLSPLAIPSVFRCGELPAGMAPGIPTGFADLDAALPGGGWPPGALTEMLCDACGIGEVSLLLPALRHLGQSGDWRGRGLLLINPPGLPYAPALAACGLDLASIAVLRPAREEDSLWAAEQALRTGAAAAVLLWQACARGADGAQRYPRLRRLQLAAAAGGGLGVVFAPRAVAASSSPAALRVVLQAAADGRLSVQLARRRGLARPVTLQVSSRALPQPWLAGHGLPARTSLRREPAAGRHPVAATGRGAQRGEVPAR